MITIVDYGLGNIKAFSNVYKRLNIPCRFASTNEQLQEASKLILPGVGSFDHAMDKLNSSGLRGTLDHLVLKNRVPVIGICVGMQMMANESEEGNSRGLGWIDGKVKQFKYPNDKESRMFPLPHMGWNNISPACASPLIDNLDEHKRFYFLHSYYFECARKGDVIAHANYGFDYPCIIGHENIFGIQCHPEKSHHNGVSLLKNFADL